MKQLSLFDFLPILKFQPTIKQYHDSKNIITKRCICADCGRPTIDMIGSNCYSFGIFLCPDCMEVRENEK